MPPTRDKASIAERLGQSGHPSVRAVLTAFLQDRLYFRNSDQKVFIVKAADEDPFELDRSAIAERRRNRLRGYPDPNRHQQRVAEHIKNHRGAFRISRTRTPSVRLDAVREMSRSLDEANVTLLRQRLGVETNSSVRKAIATGLALAALDGTDNNARVQPSPR